MRRYMRLIVLITVLLVLLAGIFLFFQLVAVEHLDALARALHSFESEIAAIDNKLFVFLLLMLFFVIKAAFPVLPNSALFIIAGVVFDRPVALLINVAGIALQMTLRYYYGVHRPGGYAHRMVERQERIQQILKKNENGSIPLLFIFRLLPNFPINTVSQLYGSMGCGYAEYIFVSLLGILPKLTMYTLLGNSVFDPFSPAFLVPLALLLLFSVSSVLLYWHFVYSKKKKRQEDLPPQDIASSP